jgi:hypothetical protein
LCRCAGNRTERGKCIQSDPRDRSSVPEDRESHPERSVHSGRFLAPLYSPGFSLEDFFDSGFRSGELRSQPSLGSFSAPDAWNMESTNLSDLRGCKFRGRIFLTIKIGAASAFFSILNILLWCAGIEMLGLYAGRIVAGMKDLKAPRDRSFEKNIGSAVSHLIRKAGARAVAIVLVFAPSRVPIPVPTSFPGWNSDTGHELPLLRLHLRILTQGGPVA